MPTVILLSPITIALTLLFRINGMLYYKCFHDVISVHLEGVNEMVFN
jgi:hypothetical protein